MYGPKKKKKDLSFPSSSFWTYKVPKCGLVVTFSIKINHDPVVLPLNFSLPFPALVQNLTFSAFWGLASLYKTAKHPTQCMLLNKYGTSCQRDSLTEVKTITNYSLAPRKQVTTAA